jgi:concanavalin A-like lectin/glucanase superfamily protein/uncharacterized protein DUF2341
MKNSLFIIILLISINLSFSLFQNQLSCESSGFTWLENSNYPGTFSFSDDEIGDFPSGWNVGESAGEINILSSLDNHNKIVELYDVNQSAFWFYNNFTGQTIGTIEAWIKVTDVIKESKFYILSDGPYININDGYFNYYTGSWTPIISAEANKWYHLRIDFDCSINKFYIYINGVKYGNYPTRGDCSTITQLSLYSRSVDEDYSYYIDAIGYSWDPNYHVGDNLHASCCGDDVVDLRKGLISEWHFDEGTGTTLNDSIGSNDGTLVNSPTWIIGKYGNALNFSDALDKKVIFNNPVRNTFPLSICAWLKPNAIDSDYHYAIANGGESSATYGFYLYLDNANKYQFGCKDNIIGNGIWINKAALNTDWVFICGTCFNTSSSDLIKLYVNGKSVKDASGSSNSGIDPPSNLKIGGASGGDTHNWDGLIDEVRIYNRVLSNREVEYMYEMSPYSYLNYTDTFYNGTKNVDSNYCENNNFYTNLEKASNTCNNLGFNYLIKDWILEGFNYRKNITINPLANLTNYQININPQNYNTSGLVASYHFSEESSSIKDYSGNNNYGSLYGSTIALWNLDEGTGTKIYDSTINGNDGIISGSPLWELGINGKSLHFDGVDDYITFTEDASLRLTHIGTISLWVKADSTTQDNYAGLVAKTVDGNTGGQSYAIHWRNSDSVIQGQITNAAGVNNIVRIPVFTDTNWHHLVFTWDGSALYFYDNGVLLNFTVQTIDAQSTSSHSFKIGGDSFGASSSTDDFWDGYIDEVIIINQSLNYDEVQELFYSKKTKFIEYSEGYESKGNGLKLDGVDDYVIITDNSQLDLIDTDISITSWIKPIIGTEQKIVCKEFSQGYELFFWSDGRVSTRFGGVTALTSTNTLESNKWYYVVSVFDKSTNNAKIFVNGNEWASGSVNGGITTGNSYDVYIGRRGLANTLNFNGILDEVLIYDRALSFEEINNIYHERKGRLDYSDLRFVDENDNELNYYFEFDNLVWVKVPELTESLETNITMYYGNPNTISHSNGELTFVQYKGFTKTPFHDPDIITPPFVFEASVRQTSNSEYVMWGVDDYNNNMDSTSGDAISIMTYATGNNRYFKNWNNGVQTSPQDTPHFTLNKWYKLKITIENSSFSKAYTSDYANLLTATTNVPFGSSMGLAMQFTSGMGEQFYSFIRKFVSTEPTITVSNEEYVDGNSDGLVAHYTFDQDVDNKTIDNIGKNTGSLFGSTVGLWHFDNPYYSPIDSTSYSNNGGLKGDTVLLMHFDEGTGNPLDESGYGNDGTLYNTPTWTSDSISGYALDFEASSSEYVLTDLTNANNNWALCAWYKPESINIEDVGVGMPVIDSDDPGDYGSGFGIDSDQLRVMYNNGWLQYSYDFELGKWYHTCVVFDRVNSDVTAYIDGSQVGSTGVSYTTETSFVNFNIGRDPANSRYFDGLIDEVAIYKRAIIASEVAELYNFKKAKFIEYNSFAMSGSSIELDGVDDYVDLGNPASLTTNIGTNSFSICSYFKTSSTGTRKQIVSLGSLTKNQGAWFFIDTDNKVHFDLSSTAGTSSSVTVTDGQWHHACVVNTNNNFQIYVDGITSGSLVGMNPNIASGAAVIGTAISKDNWWFNGNLDEVAIYNKSITAEEVKYSYDSKKAQFMEHVEGQIGKCLEFDGVNDYVDLNDNFDLGTKNMTILAWIKTTDNQNYASIAGKPYYGSKEGRYSIHVRTGGKIGIISQSSTGIIETTSQNSINDGEWHFVVGVFNRNEGNKIYIDSLLDGSIEGISTNDNWNTTDNFNIGYYNNNVNGYFNGSIDELRIYNRVLSTDEISELYSLIISNYGCCGDDYNLDTFYNGSIGSTNNFCQNGELINQPIDSNQTICETYNYNWFSGTTTGTNNSCCGDDSLESFYNGTIGTTNNFCQNGELINQPIDSNQTICETYNYDWLTQTSTSGNYPRCCNDDLTNDLFSAFNSDLLTSQSSTCQRCDQGSYYSSITYYGNGYVTSTGTSRTCYYGNIICAGNLGANGTTINIYGWGYYTGNLALDTNIACLSLAGTCSDGSYSNSTTINIYGNGYKLANTCYYRSMNCAESVATNGSICILNSQSDPCIAGQGCLNYPTLIGNASTNSSINSGLSNYINLTWTSTGITPTGYYLENSSDGITYTQIIQTSLTNYIDYSAILDNTMHYYRIKSYYLTYNSTYNYLNITTNDRTSYEHSILYVNNNTNSATITNLMNDSGLILYLPLEEGSGITTKDWSSFNSTAIISSESWSNGKYGNAFDFAGNKYVSFDDEYNFSSSFTVMAWVNPKSNGWYNVIVGKNLYADMSGFVLGTWEAHNKFSFRLNSLALVNDEVYDITGNTWYHVAGVYDDANNLIKLYVNGVLKKSTTANSFTDSIKPLHVSGGYSQVGDFGYCLNGTIDEVKIYNKSLTSKEIINEMQSGKPNFQIFRSTTYGGEYLPIINNSNSLYIDLNANDTSLPNTPSIPTIILLSTTSLQISWSNVNDFGNSYYFYSKIYDVSENYNTSLIDNTTIISGVNSYQINGTTGTSGWTNSAIIDSSLECFSNYSYHIKAKDNANNIGLLSSFSTPTYPISYIGGCAGVDGFCIDSQKCYVPFNCSGFDCVNTNCDGGENNSNICVAELCNINGYSLINHETINGCNCVSTGTCDEGYCENDNTCNYDLSCTSYGWTGQECSLITECVGDCTIGTCNYSLGGNCSASGCSGGGSVHDPDEAMSYCTGCSQEWIGGSACCGDDGDDEYFNNEGVDNFCCYNGSVWSNYEKQESLLCYNGLMYDCNNQITHSFPINSNTGDSKGELTCSQNNNWTGQSESYSVSTIETQNKIIYFESGTKLLNGLSFNITNPSIDYQSYSLNLYYTQGYSHFSQTKTNTQTIIIPPTSTKIIYIDVYPTIVGEILYTLSASNINNPDEYFVRQFSIQIVMPLREETGEIIYSLDEFTIFDFIVSFLNKIFFN